jgi:N-acetylneuraminate synthase
MRAFPLLSFGRTYVIAEIGVNHNGDPDMARQMIDVAKSAGADAVKFQTFNPAKLVTSRAEKAAYQTANDGRAESQREMLERLVLSKNDLLAIADYTRATGLEFLSTPFDADSAALLDSLDVAAFKISSGDLTALDYLRTLARYGRPMILSTGMGSLVETAEAVTAISEAGDPPLALLHCVSNYPAAPEAANLRAIDTLEQAFQVPVGWSDHTLGEAVAVAAVARGAVIVEKHFTLDKSLPGPDHKASLSPEELQSYIAAIRTVELALGDGIKRPHPSELPTIAAARRSLILNRDMAAGEVIGEADIVTLRPGHGLAPKHRVHVIGRTMQAARPQGHVLSWSDLT